MKKLLYLLCSIALIACTKPPSFDGVWLGTAYEIDKNVHRPFAYILHAQDSGILHAFPLGTADTSATKWEMQNGFLHLDTLKLSPSKFILTEEQFIRNDAYKTYFQKLDSPNNLDSTQLKKVLENSTWGSQFDTLFFEASGKLRIQNKNDSLSAEVCWEIIQERGFTFLMKKGNQVDCQGFIRYPELVRSFDQNTLLIERWRDGKWQSITYSRASKTKNNFPLNPVQLCNPYLYRNNPNDRYYYKNTFYKGGIYKINKLLNAFYKAPKNNEESGLLKVEFIVNCQGKPSHFSILELDENYRKRKFSPEISEQLYVFTKSLNDWEAGVNKNGESIDTYRFLTYKIRNGKVVEIFP